jgi:hypothetical protein
MEGLLGRLPPPEPLLLDQRTLFRAPFHWSSPVWKSPLPLKTNIFVWQLLRNRLPSGMEVAKWHRPCNGLFSLCDVPEDTTHTLFSCPVAQFLGRFVSEVLGTE